MILRQATLSDLNALTELEHRMFSYDCISRRQFRHLILKGNCFLGLALENDELAGYILYFFRRNRLFCTLYSLVVSDRFLRRGIASQLMDFGFSEVLRRGLRVCHAKTKIDNLPMQAVFDRFGWKRVGSVNRGFYSDGTDALSYKKEIHYS